MKLTCKNNMLPCDHPLIMGVLNVTPDSLSDGNKFFNTKAAMKKAESKELTEQTTERLEKARKTHFSKYTKL